MKSGNVSGTCRRFAVTQTLYYAFQDEPEQGAKAARCIDVSETETLKHDQPTAHPLGRGAAGRRNKLPREIRRRGLQQRRVPVGASPS